MHDGFFTLAALALVWGMKHGLDADHLATIDGLTRFNAQVGRKHLARLCGMLFSLGHGAVVCVVAVGASLLLHGEAMPDWLDSVGGWISTVFLLALGALNLYAVFTTPAHEMVSPLGLKGRWLGRLRQAGHPLLVMLVGALFAISFDTLSQAALFSTTSVHHGGAGHALMLALCFMLGMLLTDAANGLWIAHLLRRADASARLASRVMGLTVALLSLSVAGLGLSRRYIPEAAAWQDGRELAIGLLVIAVVAVSYVCARYWPRNSAAVSLR